VPRPTGSGAGAYSWQRPSLVGSLTGPLPVSVSATTQPRSTPPCRTSSRRTATPSRAALRNDVVDHLPAALPHMTARRGHRQSWRRPPVRGRACCWGGRPGGHVKRTGAADRHRETVPPACNGPPAHRSRGAALKAITTERMPRKSWNARRVVSGCRLASPLVACGVAASHHTTHIFQSGGLLVGFGGRSSGGVPAGATPHPAEVQKRSLVVDRRAFLARHNPPAYRLLQRRTSSHHL